MEKRPLRYMDGYTESVWKSLVVKSLRIGWANGLREAAARLSPSTMESLLLCGMFEDTFPPVEDWKEVVAEIKDGRYDELCIRNTHHGRGLTDQFCDLEPEAVAASKTRQSYIWSRAKERTPGLWLPPRCLNCYYTWDSMAPRKTDRDYRELDDTPFTGIPECILDLHTYEGKRDGRRVTLLSGTYDQHRAIGRMVMKGGWEAVRSKVHAEEKFPVTAKGQKVDAPKSKVVTRTLFDAW